MTKMIKLSLVAAVAVAGLSTTVSANTLEDAIKGVKFGGSVEYRMEHRDIEAEDGRTGTKLSNTNKSGENAKIVLAGSVPVNDKVTFSAKAVLNGQGSSMGDSTATTQGALSVNVAKFTYKTGGFALTAGMQELNTPWTDAGDGARANGLLATYSMKNITVAAAYLRDSQMGIDQNANINENDLGALAVIGSFGKFSFQAWALNIATLKDSNGIDEVSSSTTTYGVQVKQPDGTFDFAENDVTTINPDAPSTALRHGGKATALLATLNVGPVKLDASHAMLKGYNNTLRTQELSKLVATIKAGPVAIVLGAAKGGKNGNLVTFDSDAKAGFESWMIRAGQGAQSDLSAFTAAVVVPAGPTSIKLQYTAAEFDDARRDNANAFGITSTDADEILVQVSYKMSKNFGGYLRLAQLNAENETRNSFYSTTATDVTVQRARLSVKYTF